MRGERTKLWVCFFYAIVIGVIIGYSWRMYHESENQVTQEITLEIQKKE